MTKYLKAAFLYHWNLLAFGAAVALGAMSGYPDVVLPLVLAGEVAYLGLLGTHPKFQKYVDAQEAKVTREQAAMSSEEALGRILDNLPDRYVERFKSLRARCIELRQIALGIRDPHATEDAPPLEAMQLAGLDKLLWIYLRMLYTQHMLERFFKRTTEADIQRNIKRLEDQLRNLGDPGTDEQKQKVKKTLEDNLATSRERLANYQKARNNSELVALELDRLENKINSLSELAVNRQEPNFISSQIDQVASSMVQTERTMSDLQFVTGLAPLDEEVPELVRRDTVAMKK